MGKRARIPRSRERVAKLDPSLVFFLPSLWGSTPVPAVSILSVCFTHSRAGSPTRSRRRLGMLCVFLVKRDFV